MYVTRQEYNLTQKNFFLFYFIEKKKKVSSNLVRRRTIDNSDIDARWPSVLSSFPA
jgi:hypothetical protein